MANDNDTPSHQSSESWDYEEEYNPPFLPALILFPPLAPCFWKYHVRMNHEKLSLGYSYFFRQEIQISQVIKAEAIDHVNGLFEWGGWGYRKNLQWHTGYISKNGPAVRLTFKDEENKEVVIWFNCENPAKICEMINGGNE